MIVEEKFLRISKNIPKEFAFQIPGGNDPHRTLRQQANATT